ncbi:MAG: glycosyl hydrolase family 17 protein [Acidiphilium sp.]|nr:glycosyl hydrolase family 17 protein [Acidiphilium sp.]MDD4936046.1 glycosyl hydrolase family 17 protein [Acidiphilium sp.]
MRSARPYLIFIFGLITLAAWYWPNRPQAGGVTMPDARFHSVSYAPFRAWQSPLTKTFPTKAEVAQDLKLIAQHADGIRTYSSMEGDYDIGALAKQAGLKVWVGIWLGSNPVDNAREMAAGIAQANAHPHTDTRVVVGNEVLLRRDLSSEDLIKDIDYVKARVAQPVAYADVASFWFQFPQVAKHVDIVMIHLLPYWQNHPVNVDAAIARIGRTIAETERKFPGKRISVGETGWPSRGRWRGDAAPSRVNEAVFLRKFVALADRDRVDYNLIEAFDQNWKYHDEGIAGANWGIWNAARQPKFPLSGPVIERPHWPLYAGMAVLLAVGLAIFSGAYRFGTVALAFGLGNALAYAVAITWHVLYDESLIICAVVNLPAQAALAWFAMRRAVKGKALPAASGAETILLLRASMFGHARLRDWRVSRFDHLWFLFVSAAAIIQAFLVFDPRYRDAPFAVLAVPVVVALWRIAAWDFPPVQSWRDWLPSAVLASGAVASVVISGLLNTEFLVWNGLALILAAPSLIGWGRTRAIHRSGPPETASVDAG